MNLARVLLAVAVAFGVSCGSVPDAVRYSQEAAVSQAEEDFEAGKPRIYAAGGIAIFEPGVEDSQKALVARLPRDGSLAGCTNPKVGYSVDFARAYNRRIVELLQGKS